MEKDFSTNFPTNSFTSSMGSANTETEGEEDEEEDEEEEKPRQTSTAKIASTVFSLAICLVAIVALAFFTNMQRQPDFRAFNTLATSSGYPDMSALVIAFQAMATVALAFGCWGLTLICKDRSVSYFIIVGIALAFCALLLAATGFMFGKQAAPDVHFISQELCMSSPGLQWTWRCGEAPLPAPPPPAQSPAPPPSNSSNSSTATPAPLARQPTPAPRARRAQLPAFGDEEDRCDMLRSLCRASAFTTARGASCQCLAQGEEQGGAWAFTTDDTGYHCDEWRTGEEEWCYVDPHSACANSTADASSGLLRSTDPCQGTLRQDSGAAAGHLEFACLLTSILGNLMMVAILSALCIRLGALQRRQSPKPRVGPSREMTVVERSIGMSERFANAQQMAIQKIGRSSAQETKLLVFSLFKQATEGDCRDASVPVKATERKKHQAWVAHRGMPQQQAILRYCEAVENA